MPDNVGTDRLRESGLDGDDADDEWCEDHIFPAQECSGAFPYRIADGPHALVPRIGPHHAESSESSE